MNERIREQMSALMDDELSETERDLLLRRMYEDRALAAAWSRMHLVRDALHQELPRRVDPGLAARVRAAVEREPVAAAPRPAARDWLRPVAGLAVAASVAGLAFVGLQRMAAPDDPPPRSAILLAEAAERAPAAPRGTRWDRPEAASRLNAYLVNHNEYAGAPLQGMMSYVRIAGYDAEP